MNETQIEAVGRTVVATSVWTALAFALIDAGRVVGRTLWVFGTLALLAGIGVWLYKHWTEVLGWF